MFWHKEWCNTIVLSLITCLLIVPFGVWLIDKAEAFMSLTWGPRRRHTGGLVSSDYNETCYDEVIGLFCAAILIWPFRVHSILPLLAIFVLFRILDTFKPWPISAIEKIWEQSNPPFSVIIDDVAAGFISGIPVSLYLWLVK